MKHWLDMEGLTSREACNALYDLAMEVPHDQAVVELGVFKGRSLAALAAGAEAGCGAQVYGVDPFNLPRPSKPKYSSDETYAEVQTNLEGYGAHLIRGFSATVAPRWDASLKIGAIYIDSDHRELPVLADVAAWSPHFIPGRTVIAFDDACADFPGVVKAIRKLEHRGRIDCVHMATDRLCVSRFVK